MKKVRSSCQCLAGIFGVIGVFLLTSCESSVDDVVGVRIANQTAVTLSIYLDGGTSPELTVAARSNGMLVTSAGTRKIRWQGGAIAGEMDAAIQQNESRTLTIRGSGNAYSFQ